MCVTCAIPVKHETPPSTLPLFGITARHLVLTPYALATTGDKVAALSGLPLGECFDTSSPYHPQFYSPQSTGAVPSKAAAVHSGNRRRPRVAAGRDASDETFTVRGSVCGVRYMPKTVPPQAVKHAIRAMARDTTGTVHVASPAMHSPARRRSRRSPGVHARHPTHTPPRLGRAVEATGRTEYRPSHERHVTAMNHHRQNDVGGNAAPEPHAMRVYHDAKRREEVEDRDGERLFDDYSVYDPRHRSKLSAGSDTRPR